MSIGLIGKKIGMTREFFDSGISVPVTVLSIEKGRILDVITKEKRGYDAIRVGFGKIKNSKLTKQMKGFFKRKSTEPRKILREFRVNDIANYKEGNEIGLELFKDQKFVDITSKTIGKGFAGVMKRHNLPTILFLYQHQKLNLISLMPLQSVVLALKYQLIFYEF